MRKIIGSILLALFVVLHVSAQTAAETPETKANSVTEKINTATSLKSEQMSKVSSLMLDYYKKKDAIQTDKNLKQKDRDAKLKALKDSKEKMLATILTPEQLKKWKAYKENEKKSKKKKK